MLTYSLWISTHGGGQMNDSHFSDTSATSLNEFISEWLGDPGAVKDYTVRFTTPIPVDTHKPAEIVFGGKIKSKDEESRTAVISIGATFEGKRIFGHRATATVQLG